MFFGKERFMSGKRYSSPGGFTLVEIMVVLAILVLLLALVGPRVLKTQEKADVKITTTQIKNIEQTLDQYKVDNRSYPTTEEGLSALLAKPADEARARNWGGPSDIWSAGPDGKDETPDDVKNWTEDGEQRNDGDSQQSLAAQP
jgi:general secretion pathway protein G